MTEQRADELARRITAVIGDLVCAEAEVVAVRVMRDRDAGKFTVPGECEPISITHRELEEVLREALCAAPDSSGETEEQP